MEQLLENVIPDLQEFGSSRHLEGTLEESILHKGNEDMTLPQGVDYSIDLTNTGEAILLSGSAHALVQTQCARCLAPVTVESEGDVEGYYLFEHVDELDGYEKDEFDFINDDGTIDLSSPIEAAITFGMPFVVVCKEDCAGLCPSCGADLNEGPCACEQEDEIDPTNPFAVLAGLSFDDNKEDE